jgi:hypothetical protein
LRSTGQHRKILIVGVQQQWLALCVIKGKRLLYNTCRPDKQATRNPGDVMQGVPHLCQLSLLVTCSQQL